MATLTTWITAAQLKERYKGTSLQPDEKIEEAIDQAKNEILDAVAGRYNTASWGASPPPGLISLHVQLVFGLTARGTHTGDRSTPSDNTAKEAREEARKTLSAYATGSRKLRLTTGATAESPVVVGSDFNTLEKPVFGFRDPITWGIFPVDSDGSGGPDGMGYP